MIAIAGPNLPHEVLRAAGVHGGPVRFDPDRDTASASRWMESKFFPWAPAVLSHWLEGAYDAFDAVMFSRADDSSQRLYYYICELQRQGEIGGPEPLIFDIAKIPRESSLVHTTAKVRALAESLGVSDGALEKEISRSNAARAPLPAPSAPACLLTGSPPPDGRLEQVIAASGFHPVATDITTEWMLPGPPIPEGTGDPVEALARQLQAFPVGSRTFARPAETLAARIADCDARAVILWRIEEDEGQVWHLPQERRMLEELAIPHLILTRRDWLMRDDTAAVLTDFLEGVLA